MACLKTVCTSLIEPFNSLLNGRICWSLSQWSVLQNKQGLLFPFNIFVVTFEIEIWSFTLFISFGLYWFIATRADEFPFGLNFIDFDSWGNCLGIGCFVVWNLVTSSFLCTNSITNHLNLSTDQLSFCDFIWYTLSNIHSSYSLYWNDPDSHLFLGVVEGSFHRFDCRFFLFNWIRYIVILYCCGFTIFLN